MYGYLPASRDDYYGPIAKYAAHRQNLMQVRDPRLLPPAGTLDVSNMEVMEKSTYGLFSRARTVDDSGELDDIYVDIFHLVPVTLDGITKYSDTCSTWVYDAKDFFPPKQGMLGNRMYPVPARTRKHLIYTYHDLGLPGKWNEQKQEQTGIDSDDTKFKHISPSTHPCRQQIVEDVHGHQHFYLPHWRGRTTSTAKKPATAERTERTGA